MRIVSWNMHRRKDGTWEYIINSLNPDFAFLQETSPMNEFVSAKNLLRLEIKKNIFSGIYLKEDTPKNIKMPADKIGMINQCASVQNENFGQIFFINVYGRLGTPQGLPIPLLGLINLYVQILRNEIGRAHV